MQSDRISGTSNRKGGGVISLGEDGTDDIYRYFERWQRISTLFLPATVACRLPAACGAVQRFFQLVVLFGGCRPVEARLYLVGKAAALKQISLFFQLRLV